MKQIEKLFNQTFKKTYDTPKRLNRSSTKIPPAVIEEIEAGQFTHESLKTLGAKVPIFIYKTCITIHGNFPDIGTSRINGYKNVIQNENGSLEVRYSAIDTDKMKLIQKVLRYTKSEYRLNSDSQGHVIERSIPVTKATYQAKQAEIAPDLQRIGAANLYGHFCTYLGEIWGQYYIVVSITPVTIPEAEVNNFIAVLLGQPAESIPALLQEIEDAERKQEIKERQDAERREQQKQEHQRRMQPYIDAIANLPKCNNPLQGTIITTAVTIEGRPCYKIVKARQVDRFKRFYTSEARAMSIEDAKAGKIEFRDRTKLYTAKDFVGRDYRLFA